MPRRAASVLRLPALALIGLLLSSAGLDAQERATVEIVPQIGHARDVTSAAFSRDGSHVLTGSEDGTLKLWDIATTRLLRTFSGHKGSVTVVALSPDGSRALSGGKDKTIRLWEVATGRLIGTVYAHLDSSSEVSSVAFSPDGRRLLSSSRGEGAAKLWDAETRRLLRMFPHSKGAFHSSVSAAAFSPDGTRVATGGVGDHMVSLWNAETGKRLKTFGKLPEKTFGYRVNLAFSPDGTGLLTGDTESLQLWDTAKGTPIRTLASHGLGVSGGSGLGGAFGITFVAFSPDGALALTSDRQNGLEHWSVATGQLVRTFKPKSGGPVAISPDATRALSQGTFDRLTLWDTASGQLLRTFEKQAFAVGSVAASPDGAHLLTVDTKIRLWDASSGTLTRSIGGRTTANTVAFSPDGTRLLAGRFNALDLWDVASGQRVRRITTLTPELVAFTADGSRLIGFVPDPSMPKRSERLSNIVTWDAASGRRLLTFKVRSDTGLGPAVAFSPAGTRFLAEPKYDEPFRVWDVTSGKLLHTFGDKDSANHVQSSAFSADGARVASGHIDGALRLWEPASSKLLRTLRHARSVDALAFSRDGSRLLSGSADNTVKLWDVATGKAIRTFEGHTGEVNAVAFSPDEKRVVSGSDDTTARVWDAATGELLAILLTRPVTRTRTGEWLVITPEGFFDASAKGAEMLTVVRGLEVFGIDQFYQTLYRPDLVREKLAGDPDGKVRAAAARLDLGKLVDSGRVPNVRIASHKAESTSPDDRVTLKAQIIDQGGGIGRAEWRINGITVGVIEKAGTGAAGKPVSVQQTVALDPGENTVELVAYNGANLVASAPARSRITWTGTEPSVPPRLYVLTVGINHYLDSALNLRYAVPDAKTLAAAFKKAGGGHYESVSVTNVLDSGATAAKLDRVFDDLAGKVRPRDVFVFFAAGHGKTLDGRYYFIPYDLRYRTDQSLKDDAIDQDKLQAWFARILAKKAVLMFDTCEAGSLTERGKTRGGLEHKAALGRLIQATGRATLTASTATQAAYEGHGGHGVFTFAILDSLARGDISSNGLIELAELIQHVDGLVPAITEKRWGAKQYPQMDAYGSNFPLVRQVPALAPASGDAIIIPLKPTHVSTENLQIFKEPGSGPADEPLAAFKAVTLVKRQGAWALIAREGDVLGYVAEAKLHELK